MKYFTFLLCCTLFVSCRYFEKQKVYSEDLVKEELETINWNAVDQYPSFSVCDSISGKTERKICFEHTILTHVNAYLSDQNIIVSNDVKDTIKVRLSIDNMGGLKILNIDANSVTRSEIPTIDSLLHQSLKSVPKVYPAIKRGQQVNTEFLMPVIVTIN